MVVLKDTMVNQIMGGKIKFLENNTLGGKKKKSKNGIKQIGFNHK